MENASRAIIIAGGMLMAVLVTSLIIYGLNNLRSYQNTQDSAKRVEQITEFNKPLEAFNKRVVSGSDMISLGNLVVDYNKRYSTDEKYTPIVVWIKMKAEYNNTREKVIPKNPYTTNKIGGKLTDYIALYDTFPDKDKIIFKELYFQCTKIDNDSLGRIVVMNFSELTKK